MFTRHDLRPLTRDHARAAAQALGVALDGLDVDQVRHAFRAVVMQVHPDRVATGAAEDAETRAAEVIEAAAAARTTLIRWLQEQPDPHCPVCRGTGFIVRPGGFGAPQPCPKGC